MKTSSVIRILILWQLWLWKENCVWKNQFTSFKPIVYRNQMLHQPTECLLTNLSILFICNYLFYWIHIFFNLIVQLVLTSSFATFTIRTGVATIPLMREVSFVSLKNVFANWNYPSRIVCKFLRKWRLHII